VGSVRLFGVGLLVWLQGTAASAQPPTVLFEPAARTGFLTRVMAVASLEALGEGDPDFHWDADFGISADVLDLPRGRVHLAFSYETILGDELQPFDPRQGNYTIDTLGTIRHGRFEVGLLLHHVSRHLGDRAKDFGIAWNDLGVVITHAGTGGPWRWQARGLLARSVLHDFVDYRGDAGGDLAVRRTLRPWVSVLANAGGHARFVAASPLGRGTQYGGRAEAGVRFEGRAGALELVVGAERRVDADPFEFAPRQWAFAGLRIVSR
jgi:hypothetical protein